MSALYPVDVAMLVVISSLRDMSLDLAETLGIGTFLADNLQNNNLCAQYTNIHSFLQGLREVVQQSSLVFFREAMTVCDIDGLFDLFNAVKLVFIQKENYYPNEAIVPSIIKRDSLVGMYVRGLVSRWNSLSFSAICDVFKSYVEFCKELGSAKPRDHTQLPYAACDIPKRGSLDYIVAAEKAMLNNDTFSALSNIHKYFDDIEKDKLKIQTEVPTQTQSIASVGVVRQQEAMLSLATMWIQNKQFSQAIIATEEGMRMAHQLGDHSSVARALLLLYYVVDREPVRGEQCVLGNPSAESVLIRCIQRCTELNLRDLEAQAILLLVRLRFHGKLENKPCHLQLSGGINSIEEEFYRYRQTTKNCRAGLYSTRQSRVSPSALWSMMLSALLVKSLYAPDGNASDSRSVGATALKRQKVDYCGSVSDVMELMGHAGIVASSFWSRLGISCLAELSSKRTLRQCGVFVPLEVIDHLCSFLSEIWSKSQDNGAMITLAHILKFSCAESGKIPEISISRRCNQAGRLLHASKRILLPVESSQCEPRMILSCISLLQLRQILYTCGPNDISRRDLLLQLSQILMQTHARGKYRYLSYEAKVLRQFLLIFYNNELPMKSRTEQTSGQQNNTVFEGECTILRVIADLFLEPKYMSNGVLKLQDAFEFSRKSYAPHCDASLSILSSLLVCNPLCLL